MKKLLFLLALVALAAWSGFIWAGTEVDGNPGTTPLSVTAVTQSVTFTAVRTSLLLKNDDTTNEVYYRVFNCGTTIAAVTTANGRELKAGETVRFTHNPRSDSGIGFCGFSIICAAGETASVRWVAK